MADTEQILRVLSGFLDYEHHVVDMKSAMAKLENPRKDLESILSDSSVPEWHYYALAGLRSIVASGPISTEDGEVILESTKRVAQQHGIDEFYKSFDALALARDNAQFLIAFADDLLLHQDQRDWLWLAFYAVGAILQRWPDSLPDDLAMRLVAAFNEVPESSRKSQMAEIAEAVSRSARPTPA